VTEFEVCAFTQICTTDNGATLDPVSYLEMLSLDRLGERERERERGEELSKRETKRVQVI
jgi:hypothetical protein